MSNEKKIVNISVRNLRATGDGTVIVCDNSDYVLHFDFDSEWDDKKAKTARINYNGTKCIDLPLLGNKVEIERTPVAWQLQIGAYADNIKTTTPAIFNCDFSILSSNPIHEEIPEDTYNKIMALINAIDDAIIDVSVLPLEDINTNALYRRGGSIFHYYNGAWMGIGSGGGSGGSGADGITPMLKINKDNYWCVSYDNGKNWVSLNVKATGADGKDGVDGKDGADGLTPYIKYGYWWIGDTNTYVKAEAVDGADGKDGVDGITPEFKVENGELKVSYDNGDTWSTLGYIKGADGKDGKDGVDGITPKLKIGEDNYWYASYDNGTTWVSLNVKATGDTFTMSDIDDELDNELPEGRVYNEELHVVLKDMDRVYAERSTNDGGGVSPLYYISANSAAERLFSPIGYTNFDEMCADMEWDTTNVKDDYYTTRVVNNVTEYYPKLASIVKRTRDDNVRTNNPVDSTDAVPYGYFKKYTFENPNVSNYQVVRKGSNGQLFSTAVADTLTTKGTFVQRDSVGCVRGETKENNADKTAIEGTTLVNVTYLNSKLSPIEAIAKGRSAGYVFKTVSHLNWWLEQSGNKEKLVTGDNLYITATDVPDYWWDGTQPQELETQKVDLSEYAKTEDIPSLDGYAKTEDIKISGTVSKAIGGISVGKTYNDADLTTVLKDMLFPYVAPSGVSFGIYTSSDTLISGTYEYGKTLTATKAKFTFTKGSKDITYVKIGTTSGGNDLYEGSSVTSGSFITLTKSVGFNGTTNKTIYYTISDGTTPISNSVPISYAYYNYVAVTKTTTAPASHSDASNIGTNTEKEIKTVDNSYVWFLMPNQNRDLIQQWKSGAWNNMTTTYVGTVAFKTTTGVNAAYHAYRTAELMKDTANYRIIKGEN